MKPDCEHATKRWMRPWAGGFKLKRIPPINRFTHEMWHQKCADCGVVLQQRRLSGNAPEPTD